MAEGVWKGVYPQVFGRSKQLSLKTFFYPRKGRDGGGKNGKRMTKIVATTLLPAVNRPNADRWNAARTCQYNTYTLYLSNDQFLHILIHLEGLINHICLSKCLDIKSLSPILHHGSISCKNRNTSFNMDQIILGHTTYPIENMILGGACFPT